MTIRLLLVPVLAIASATMFAQAQERHVHSPGASALKLGSVQFPNSGNKAAQEPFLRGIALLHSFEYEEAAEQFRAAQKADRSFALAYWAEAMTYIHPLWGEDDPEAARAALGRLAPAPDTRLAKAHDPRERAYGVAVEALFDAGDVPARARGFAARMRDLVTKYPNDPEAAAFTSLALMFVGLAGDLPPDDQRAAQTDAVTFAQRVFDEHPEHPGGAHYLIHATDAPERAPRGLVAARRYAEIAPDAEHALHMPSHIFLQLGLWQDVISSNERAWAASRAEVAARHLPSSELSFHALQWLQYAYLQAGRYAASRQTIQTARDVLAGVDVANATSSDARYTVGFLQFQHAANTGDWSGDVCQQSLPGPSRAGESDRERSFRAQASYQAVISAVMCGQGGAGISEAEIRLSSSSPNNPSATALRAALRHANLLAYGRTGTASDVEQLLADPASPSPALVGPPGSLRLEELLGEARLKAGRPQAAVAAYERALQLTPNRSAALLGLARARRAAGDTQGAADAYRKLLDNWRGADASIPTLREVKEGADSLRR